MISKWEATGQLANWPTFLHLSGAVVRLLYAMVNFGRFECEQMYIIANLECNSFTARGLVLFHSEMKLF